MRTLTLLALATLLLLAINVYVYRHTKRAFGTRWQTSLRVLLSVIVFGMIASVGSRLLARSWITDWTHPVAILGLGIEVAVSMAMVGYLLVDTARLVGKLWVRFRTRGARTTTEEPAAEHAPSRREFIANTASLSILAASSATSAYGILFGRHDYEIETVPIRIPGLSSRLDGYTIVQLSDIHFGAFVGEPELRAAVERVRTARPDLVVLTGDLLDHDVAYAPLLGKLIRELEPLARDGVRVIPGNHDYYAGVDEVLRTATRAGGHVLFNRGEVIGQGRDAFAMLGVDDLWARRSIPGRGPQLEHALATVPRDLPRILLAHNPAFFPEAAPHVQLQLSGHTHGGQINIGDAVTTRLVRGGYLRGHYERGESQLYVNRGFGTAGPPIRVGSSPEITRVVLTSRA